MLLTPLPFAAAAQRTSCLDLDLRLQAVPLQGRQIHDTQVWAAPSRNTVAISECTAAASGATYLGPQPLESAFLTNHRSYSTMAVSTFSIILKDDSEASTEHKCVQVSTEVLLESKSRCMPLKERVSACCALRHDEVPGPMQLCVNHRLVMTGGSSAARWPGRGRGKIAALDRLRACGGLPGRACPSSHVCW
jgi:hypothetical protein